jgi:RNA polymerase sigma-70 factor, ECF subfamily
VVGTAVTPRETPASIEDLFRRGAAAAPGVSLSRDLFGENLARLARTTNVPAVDLRRLHVEDLYLAWACLARVDGALAAFRRLHGPAVRAAIVRLSSAADVREDIEQRFYEDVMLGNARHAAPKIGTYTGQGPLGRWAVVVAQRTALMMLRSAGAERRARRGAAMERVIFAVPTDVALVRERYRPAFERILADAIAGLSDRERVLLRLHFGQGVGLPDLGRMYGVDRSTASRWLSSIRSKLAAKVRSLLKSRLGVDPEEIESLVRLLMSQVSTGLSSDPRPP